MFNEGGLQEVSLRDISKQVGISVGNLNYHFPTTNDIILALSIQLVEEINNSINNKMANADAAQDPLTSLFELMKISFATQLKYQFMFNSRYAEIVVNIPEIQEHYQKTFQGHFTVGVEHIEHLIDQGYIDKSLLKDVNGFTYMVNMLGTFWQQELAIFQPDLSDNRKIDQALAVMFQAYRPYLTTKGLDILNPLLIELVPYKPLVNAHR